MREQEFDHVFQIHDKHICVDIPKEKCNQIYVDGELMGTVWLYSRQGLPCFVCRDYRLNPYLERIIIELENFYQDHYA